MTGDEKKDIAGERANIFSLVLLRKDALGTRLANESDGADKRLLRSSFIVS